ncbi:hypothetical protein MIZ01_1728 [Sideroxyarcus emersonii]|uniref:Transporter n=1 Tax=Sideroxyarcus emersonii TaxID=2764705 RepID=A0AAN1XAY6_9PROT|nr:hypothetical protein [Sideroxyarcus emersonii]BCK87931.1 hypothetical protein MIZ01_1728 [Sideroxyarcus emersonii]
MRNYLRFGLLAICALRGFAAFAAPDEIQVYTDEMNAPGKFGLEQHLNYVLKGTQTPAYPGEMVTNHVAQVTPEFSYGISDTLEAGLYVPLATTPGGYTFLNALRLRLKYIAPKHDDDMFYGLNVEVGRDTLRTSDSISGMELRPIIGYRDAKWLVSFNPILNMGLAANVSRQPHFEPAFKLTRSVGDGVRSGFEYYGTYGSLSHLPPGNQFGHTLYAVADMEKGGFDVNFGIGRGFVNATDTWVMKAIIGFPFD